MSFFPEICKETKILLNDEFDLICAKKLNQALKEKGIRNSLSTPPFRKLREIDHLSKEDIQQVLDWYVLHVKEEYIPEAFSADSFRKKFQSIQLAMKRDVPETISKEAEEILVKMKDLYWPNGGEFGLAKAVEESLKSYRVFMNKLKVVVETLEEDLRFFKTIKLPNRDNPKNFKLARMENLLRHLRDTWLHSPSYFIVGWFNQIHAEVSSWSEWSGSFKSYTITSNLKEGRFSAKLSDWIYQYCQDKNQFISLRKLIDSVPEEPTEKFSFLLQDF